MATQQSTAEPRAADGLKVYQAQYCGACHQLSVAGSTGVFGPTHDGLAVTAAQRIQDPAYRGAATTAEEYLHESIVDPKAYLVPGYEVTNHSMPAFTALSEAEVRALVALLLAQN